MFRREFLELARCATLAATVPTAWRVTWRPRFVDDPFTLGVASGDPTPDGVMLWTRLAPQPLEPDYGMDRQRTVVSWQVAADEGFRQVVQQGRATAAPELGHSVHADVQGLEPDRWYFYRFTSGDATSPVGRTRTAPALDRASSVRFAVASCQHYESGHFTAFQHLAAEELDLVTHLGDYIYEYSGVEGRIRRHANREVLALEDYRIRYGQYKADEHLRAAHARCPWLVTWDDHEVDNNYAGLQGENGMESLEQVRARRAAAYQAWWEHMPVRVPRLQSWADLSIARQVPWGTLADFWVLDTRQFRADQSCGDGSRVVPCADWEDPTRTMLGDTQERWLTAGLSSSRASWQVLAQQVMMAPWDVRPGEAQQVSMDQWSGYPAARDRLLGRIAQRAAHRTVVLTGDIHSNWVNELWENFNRFASPSVAVEFVATSIASGGDGADASASVNERTRAENPHMRWHNARRGYVRCHATPEAWQTDFRTVPFVTRPGAPVATASSWRLENGLPGVIPT
jgi:alkaline phosphatase D